jgi:hypothetical protein
VEANFKETQLRHMRLGQQVELRSDLYGGDVRYAGRITEAASIGKKFRFGPEFCVLFGVVDSGGDEFLDLEAE